ncbi:hypothetical protein SLS61_006368 [Didymella pomorum]
MADDSSSPALSKDVDKSSAAYLKRREQVRRAQRTHRKRKETYIHALESEVLALRTKARSVEEQNNELSRQLEVLKRRVGGQSAGSEVLGAEWGTGGNVDREDTGSLSVVSFKAQCLSTSLDMPGQACGVLTGKSGTRPWSISERHADMAMEFVLTLEKPCIMWAQSAVFDPLNTYPSNPPPGDSESALYHSFVEDKLVKPESCVPEDVASSLDNLLSLSSAFDLEHEVTPIQAWQHLCGFFELGAVDMNGFRKLADMLLEHVKCYG